MKYIIVPLLSLLVIYNRAGSQTLLIKGRVRCLNQSEHSTRGAANIIVVPTFMPSGSAITATNPPGYFEFNTHTAFEKLRDKQVSIYLVSACDQCTKTVKRIFVSEDQDRAVKDTAIAYMTIKDWKLDKNCEGIELSPFRADSLLAVIVKQPELDLSRVSPATALVGTPALLNLLSTITTVVGTVSNAGTFKAEHIGSGKIEYGQFLFASALSVTANTGFNFSPSRDMSEAVFWNPSAIVNSRKKYNISLLTNVKNYGKAGGYIKVNDRISVGGGFIFMNQDEYREVVYANINNNSNKVNYDSNLFKLKEYAAYISPSFKVNNKLSVGMAVKSVWQKVTIANTLQINFDDNGNVSNIFKDSTITRQKLDADISVTYKINNSLQAGLSVMNIAGAQLYGAAFVPDQQNIPMSDLRSLGAGICYKWKRLNAGIDAVFTKNGFYDAAVGLNYVPFNNALLSAGVAIKQLSYSFAFKMKYFRVAYISDNDRIVNEKRKGRSGILNGRIYGGFVIEL
ncbi:MAG: hypothetical protein KF746_05115 [Chitinophagaceae bacterium]|nr:hypothetical protein [Chitinophagaceae bacterium]